MLDALFYNLAVSFEVLDDRINELDLVLDTLDDGSQLCNLWLFFEELLVLLDTLQDSVEHPHGLHDGFPVEHVYDRTGQVVNPHFLDERRGKDLLDRRQD